MDADTLAWSFTRVRPQLTIKPMCLCTCYSPTRDTSTITCVNMYSICLNTYYLKVVTMCSAYSSLWYSVCVTWTALVPFIVLLGEPAQTLTSDGPPQCCGGSSELCSLSAGVSWETCKPIRSLDSHVTLLYCVNWRAMLWLELKECC